MENKFKASIIITTLSRSTECLYLIQQILDISNPLVKEIICVNSSEEPYSFENLIGNTKIVYQVKSSQKNQPYQRLLGAHLATGGLLIFFDDDLKIINNQIFDFLIEPFKKYKNIVGTGIREVFEEENTEYITIGKNEEYKNNLSSRILYLFKKWNPGDSWFVGAEPYQVHKAKIVEAFHSGNVPCLQKGVFLASYPIIFMPLFSIGKAKGEDKVFSLRANRFGKLFITNIACVEHPKENQSFYSYSEIKWRKEVLRSRFVCADAYASGKRQSILKARFIILWYAIWMIPHAIFNEIGTNRKFKISAFQILAIPYAIYYTWIWPIYNKKRKKYFEEILIKNIIDYNYE